MLVGGGVQRLHRRLPPLQLGPADAEHRHQRRQHDGKDGGGALFGRGGQFGFDLAEHFQLRPLDAEALLLL